MYSDCVTSASVASCVGSEYEERTKAREERSHGAVLVVVVLILVVASILVRQHTSHLLNIIRSTNTVIIQIPRQLSHVEIARFEPKLAGRDVRVLRAGDFFVA